MKNEFPNADMNKVIQMCIIHDLGECFTGDIPAFMKTKEHECTEENLLNEWVESLPEATQVEMKTLYKEMEERQSIESKIYKAIDSLEALIQHNLSDISTWSAWHALSSLYMQLCAAHFIERLSFGEPQELLLELSLCSKLVQHVSSQERAFTPLISIPLRQQHLSELWEQVVALQLKLVIKNLLLIIIIHSLIKRCIYYY